MLHEISSNINIKLHEIFGEVYVLKQVPGYRELLLSTRFIYALVPFKIVLLKCKSKCPVIGMIIKTSEFYIEAFQSKDQ